MAFFDLTTFAVKIVTLSGHIQIVGCLQVRVYVGRHLDRGVAEQPLGGAQIHSSVVQCGCIGVAQHMGVDALDAADLDDVGVPHIFECLGCHVGAFGGGDDVGCQARGDVEDLLQRIGNGQDPMGGSGFVAYILAALIIPRRPVE